MLLTKLPKLIYRHIEKLRNDFHKIPHNKKKIATPGDRCLHLNFGFWSNSYLKNNAEENSEDFIPNDSKSSLWNQENILMSLNCKQLTMVFFFL